MTALGEEKGKDLVRALPGWSIRIEDENYYQPVCCLISSQHFLEVSR